MATSKKIASRDENRVVVLIGVASKTATVGGIDFVKDETPVPIAVNPATGAIIVEKTT